MSAPDALQSESPLSNEASPSPSTVLDACSRSWIRRLRSEGPEREAAVRELHAVLLKAAWFEIRRRRDSLGDAYASEADDLARESADDALLAVLGKLDEFRGMSRFTTWAYKFALYEAAVKVRRRAWRSREVPLGFDAWERVVDGGRTPQEAVETGELLDAVRRAMTHELTPHQREVLTAVTLNDVPIDVLAERLGSTRGALYKTLHDARRKLRTALQA